MQKGLAREKARGVANKRSELVTQTLSFNIDSATCNCLQTNICWGGHNWIFSSPQANKVVPSFFNFYSALQSIKPRTQSLPQFAKGRGCQIGSLIATQYKSLSPVRALHPMQEAIITTVEASPRFGAEREEIDSLHCSTKMKSGAVVTQMSEFLRRKLSSYCLCNWFPMQHPKRRFSHIVGSIWPVRA